MTHVEKAEEFLAEVDAYNAALNRGEYAIPSPGRGYDHLQEFYAAIARKGSQTGKERRIGRRLAEYVCWATDGCNVTPWDLVTEKIPSAA